MLAFNEVWELELHASGKCSYEFLNRLEPVSTSSQFTVSVENIDPVTNQIIKSIQGNDVLGDLVLPNGTTLRGTIYAHDKVTRSGWTGDDSASDSESFIFRYVDPAGTNHEYNLLTTGNSVTIKLTAACEDQQPDNTPYCISPNDGTQSCFQVSADGFISNLNNYYADQLVSRGELIIVTVDSIETCETGGNDAVTFQIELELQPSIDIVLGVTVSHPLEVSATPSTLTFTSTNYNIEQSITITGLEDNSIDGTQNYTISLKVQDSSSELYIDKLKKINGTNCDTSKEQIKNNKKK